jgi:hypothetical protein
MWKALMAGGGGHDKTHMKVFEDIPSVLPTYSTTKTRKVKENGSHPRGSKSTEKHKK